MKIYCAQINQVWEDIDTAFEKAEECVRSADSDMVIFCEQYATGWRAKPSKFSGEEVKNRWIDLARKYNTCIVGSYQKMSDSGKPENTMLVCSPNGDVLAEYSKIHLFSPAGEDKYFSAGKEPVTFEFGGIKFGCAICFDLRFPELFREYLRLGCQAVIVQAAWAAARVADWELLLRARALENRGYVIACGCLGYGGAATSPSVEQGERLVNDSVSGVDFPGRGLVCDYEGRIIEDAGVFEGGVLLDVYEGEVVDGVKEMRGKWIKFQ